jgi:hypothetical protein
MNEEEGMTARRGPLGCHARCISHGGGGDRDGEENHQNQGYHTAISVDGPKGPKFFVKQGLIDLAGKTGAPILTMSVAALPRLSVPT